MNKFRFYIGLAVGLLVIAIQPLFQSAALPSGIQRIFGEEQQLTASDGTADDVFGAAVAIDGDTALVGAPQEMVNANILQGAAYVFIWNGSSWTEQAKLTASDGTEFDYFGTFVALDGDTALVSAFSHQVGANDNQGAVYVFTRSGTTWTEQAILTASDGAALDVFGYSIALDGDTALIGAQGDDIDTNEDQGSAYIFERNGEFWLQQTKLTAADGVIYGNFGTSVALDQGTALIGAYGDTVGANMFQGSVYVYTGSGSSWVEQQKLTATDGAAEDRFGSAVALDGDTALIGAYRDAIGANIDQGSAYVYTRSGNLWSVQVKLTAADGATGDNFGLPVVLAGDRAVIGTFRDQIGANANQGSAYVFTRSGMSWSFQAKLTASDGAMDDRFGVALAIDGNTLLVGALGDDIGTNDDQGSVYVFTDPDLAPTTTPEPGGTELIVNGGFENLGGDGKPDVTPWTIKNTTGDKGKCNKDKDGDGIPDKIVANTGDCAFQFKNVVGEAGKIQQTLDLSGIIPVVGDGLNLSFFAQSKSGATVKAKVVFKYSDDTKTKISVESSGADVYTEFTGSETLTNASITKAKISFKSAQTTGKVYVDDVSLLHSSTESGLIAVPAARLERKLP